MLCNRKPVGPSVKLDMRVRFRFIAIENRVNGYFGQFNWSVYIWSFFYQCTLSGQFNGLSIQLNLSTIKAELECSVLTRYLANQDFVLHFIFQRWPSTAIIVRNHGRFKSHLGLRSFSMHPFNSVRKYFSAFICSVYLFFIFIKYCLS